MGKFSLAEHIQKAQPPQARDIETITAEILDAKRVGGEAILTIGKGLIEAKAMLPHGDWLPWLEDRVEISTRMAQNYMRLAQHYSNTNALSYLGATKALQLLALPESERDEFLNEAHEVGGERKNVIDMTSRELAIAIKERDDALRTAAQAQADQSTAEQAREKMEADMALTKSMLDRANDQLKAAREETQVQQEAFEASEKEVARLEQELANLRSQPREVAVEVDEAAVEAARKETEERMQAQLDAAKKAQDKAEKARKAAEDAQRQAEEARKKAAVTTDPDLVLFSELLDQAQTLVTRMGGVRLKKKAKDPDTAEKLQAAMMALSTAVKEAAWQ